MCFALSFGFNLEITRLQVISLFTIIKTYWSWNLNAIACLVFYLYKSELDLDFKKLHWPGWRNNKFCQNMFLIQYQVWELMFDNIVTTYLIIYLHWSLRNYFKVIQVHEEKFISWTAYSCENQKKIINLCKSDNFVKKLHYLIPIFCTIWCLKIHF